MKFLVITLAPTLKNVNVYESYAPYVKEMNIWFDTAATVTIVSPTQYKNKLLSDPFKRTDLNIVSIPWLAFGGFISAFTSLWNLPSIIFKMISEMQKADHIHLRCPGNIGLIGCFVQIAFPKKIKTAKYAGNWDPKAKQPLSYRIQKRILSNTFLTKNMQVLVYGEWSGQTKNIKPFFTASYWDDEKDGISEKVFSDPYQFLFVGSLVEGKRPLYAIQLVEQLVKQGILASLSLFGDGILRPALEMYVEKNNLKEVIHFKGNQTAEIVREGYKQAHFLILASKSEGWPKVVAEAMFFECIPLVTSISCVPWMLDYGKRGCLLSLDLEVDTQSIVTFTNNKIGLKTMSENAKKWSQQYTLDSFEREIKKLLVCE
jgi:glycosyltransferase involved in cell wall biosynthesis